MRGTLASMKDQMPGTVKLLFQPAEEKLPNGEIGGSRRMLTEGAFNAPKPDVVFGLHLMSVGNLIRGFCHEMNNELGPVQGYAELLCGDARLSELHRRQIARIRDATKLALADIRGFGSALGWSGDPTRIRSN